MKEFLNSIEIGSQGQFTLPAYYYIAEEIFQRELRQLFESSWICVGHVSDFPQRGSFITVDVGKESLLIVRDHQDKYHAHFNVCRHRGTKLTDSPCGLAGKSFQCPYHAWTYSLNGELIGVPDEKQIPNFSREAYSLHGAAVVSFEGLIWVHCGLKPTPFELHFAAIVKRFSNWTISDLELTGTKQYEVQANWKLILQNYSECYHCAPVHPRLVELSSPHSGGNDLIDGPVMGGYMDLKAGTGSMTFTGLRCGPTLPSLTTEQSERVYYYVVFPQMLLSLHPDYVMIHWLKPRSPSHTSITCKWYFPLSSKNQKCDPQDAIQFWDQTNREDWRVSELTQAGVGSSRYTPGPYSHREAMSAALDRYYLQQIEH